MCTAIPLQPYKCHDNYRIASAIQPRQLIQKAPQARRWKSRPHIRDSIPATPTTILIIKHFRQLCIMNSVDPRHNLRAGGADPATEESYISGYEARTRWLKEISLYRLDLTNNEYSKADSRLKELLTPNKLYGTGEKDQARRCP